MYYEEIYPVKKVTKISFKFMYKKNQRKKKKLALPLTTL